MSKQFIFYLKYFTPTNVCDHLSAELVFMSCLSTCGCCLSSVVAAGCKGCVASFCNNQVCGTNWSLPSQKTHLKYYLTVSYFPPWLCPPKLYSIVN